MRITAVWARGKRRVTSTVILVQLVCVALLLGACDMGGSPTPSATATSGVSATSTSASPSPEAAITPAGTADTTATPGKQIPDTNSDRTAVPDAASPTPVALADIPTAERVSIYSLVVADLLKNEKATNIYISPYVGQGERLDDPNEDLPVPTTLDDFLQSNDKSRTYQLVEFADTVGPLEDGGKVKNSGVFLTLGQITLDSTSNDTVQVRASLYRGVASGMGNAYRFQRDPTTHTWKLLDVTGEWNDQQ